VQVHGPIRSLLPNKTRSIERGRLCLSYDAVPCNTTRSQSPFAWVVINVTDVPWQPLLAVVYLLSTFRTPFFSYLYLPGTVWSKWDFMCDVREANAKSAFNLERETQFQVTELN
jgi:hypothetical protein